MCAAKSATASGVCFLCHRRHRWHKYPLLSTDPSCRLWFVTRDTNGRSVMAIVESAQSQWGWVGSVVRFEGGNAEQCRSDGGVWTRPQRPKVSGGVGGGVWWWWGLGE